MMIKDVAICGSISVSTEMDTIYTNTKLSMYLDEVSILTYELKKKMMNINKY